MFKKKSEEVSKDAEFHADFESVEKVLKKCTKKSYQQKCEGKMHFFHFYSCSSNLFYLQLFLVHFLTTFSTDSKSA